MKTSIFYLAILLLVACSTNGSRQVASQDLPLRDLEYFPTDYHDSLVRFQAQGERLKSENPRVETGLIPIPGKTDQDLETDYLYLPIPNAEKLFVLSSGVHGAEAFAGSGVQQMFLQEILPTLHSKKISVLLIHAINPFGFKHGRRVDEDNIDLNRNFPTTDSLYDKKNPGYEALATLLAPKTKVTHPMLERLEKDANLVTGIIFGRYSVQDLIDSIGQGQHHYPKGLQFGGKAPQPQVKIIQDLVQKYAQPYKKVVFVDVHTGLGSANQLHMMTGDGGRYSNSPLLQRLLRLDQDGTNYDLATGDDPGFYPTPGDIIDFLLKAVGPDKESIAVTAEFGTVGSGILAQIRTLNRLILENQGAQNGYAKKSVEAQVKKDFRELFFPSDPKWRKMVIAKSRFVLTKMMERLEAY